MRRVIDIGVRVIRCLMPRRTAGIVALMLLSPSCLAEEGGGAFPTWAYPTLEGTGPTAPPDSVTELTVPGSSVRLTEAQIESIGKPPDWFPGDHGPLPDFMADRRGKPGFACPYCHLPSGAGRPENAAVAGLPISYIISQVKAFLSGERQCGKPGWAATGYMVRAAGDHSAQEIEAAAGYYAAQRFVSHVQVIETELVPAFGNPGMVYVKSTGQPQPIGERIIEMPEDVTLFERRDPHAHYIAYVPRGSVDRGRTLALTGGGDSSKVCGTCHGDGLKGGADLPGPPLAGRFATYIFRQLHGFQLKARHSESAAPMQAIVNGLSQSDMIALAAYAASLKP